MTTKDTDPGETSSAPTIELVRSDDSVSDDSGDTSPDTTEGTSAKEKPAEEVETGPSGMERFRATFRWIMWPLYWVDGIAYDSMSWFWNQFWSRRFEIAAIAFALFLMLGLPIIGLGGLYILHPFVGEREATLEAGPAPPTTEVVPRAQEQAPPKQPMPAEAEPVTAPEKTANQGLDCNTTADLITEHFENDELRSGLCNRWNEECGAKPPACL